jgi:hypothetical protein
MLSQVIRSIYAIHERQSIPVKIEPIVTVSESTRPALSTKTQQRCDLKDGSRIHEHSVERQAGTAIASEKRSVPIYVQSTGFRPAGSSRILTPVGLYRYMAAFSQRCQPAKYMPGSDFIIVWSMGTSRPVLLSHRTQPGASTVRSGHAQPPASFHAC